MKTCSRLRSQPNPFPVTSGLMSLASRILRVDKALAGLAGEAPGVGAILARRAGERGEIRRDQPTGPRGEGERSVPERPGARPSPPGFPI